MNKHSYKIINSEEEVIEAISNMGKNKFNDRYSNDYIDGFLAGMGEKNG